MNTFLFLMLAGVFFYYIGSKKTKTNSKKSVKSPAKRTAPSEDADAWEGSFWETAVALSTKKHVRLVYQDGAGATTTRDVSIRSFEPTKVNGLIIGYCFLRNATRTFRYDRIKKCIDVETGEIIGDLRIHLNEAYAASPPAMVAKLVDTHLDLLRIMFYVAKADGSVRAAEIEVIAALCQQASGNPAIDKDVVNTARGGLGEMNVRGFTSACERLQISNPKQYSLCCDAAKKVVATQKTIHPNEIAALAVMESLNKQPIEA